MLSFSVIYEWRTALGSLSFCMLTSAVTRLPRFAGSNLTGLSVELYSMLVESCSVTIIFTDLSTVFNEASLICFWFYCCILPPVLPCCYRRWACDFPTKLSLPLLLFITFCWTLFQFGAAFFDFGDIILLLLFLPLDFLDLNDIAAEAWPAFLYWELLSADWKLKGVNGYPSCPISSTESSY